MPERGLRQRIRGALRTAFPGALVLGWPANMWTGGGWPDLLFWLFPLLVGLEVKQGRRSKPTPLQLARHKLLREHHIPVYVVHTPAEALWIIAHIIERFPMAFDPVLMAELEAALGGPTPTPDPGPVADIDLDASEPANGKVFEEVEVALDSEQPAPDIEDLTAALLQSEEITQEQADEALVLAGAEVDTLVALKQSIDELTVAVSALTLQLLDPNEAPRPRGRKRATA